MKYTKKTNIETTEMHATWLAVNSVIGCTNGCKYCFLQSTNKNIAKPDIIKSASEAIDDLVKSKYYLADIPVCLLPNTDAFLNESNMKYLKDLLNEINLRKIFNPIVLITKKFIPDEFINILTDFKKNGHELTVYLSLSGLPQELEPNVNHEFIKQNFINLYRNNIDVIHYFRPLTPVNSTKSRIIEILDFVSKYSKASVVGGLKIKEDYFELIKFWPEILNMKDDCISCDAVWPKEAYNYFFKDHDYNDQNIFNTNFCALMQTLKKPAISYFNTYDCKKLNYCSAEQRKRCEEAFRKMKKTITKNDVIYHLNKIGHIVKEDDINIYNNKIKINKVKLKVGDIAYLTFALSAEIKAENIENSKYWNSPLKGSKPLVI